MIPHTGKTRAASPLATSRAAGFNLSFPDDCRLVARRGLASLRFTGSQADRWRSRPEARTAAPAASALSGVRIGTQGWSADNWGGLLYPKGLKPGERLGVYARVFNSVEVNSTFYAVPAVATVRKWRKTTPDNFRFNLKMPRAITHGRRLHDPEPELSAFLAAASTLGTKLGAILIQLPPSFGASGLPALERLLRLLPVDEMRFCVELRRPSLRSSRVRDMLRRHRVGLATTNLFAKPGAIDVVSGIAYIRWLGPRTVPGRPATAAGRISFDTFLDHASRWAGAIRVLAQSSLAVPCATETTGWPATASRTEIYGFFSNDYFGPGVLSAAYMMKQLGMPVRLLAESFLDFSVQGALL